jgi:CRISPR-associated protein Cas5d
VAYVIRADVVPRVATNGEAARFRDQFRRRVARGQCFAQPYLGCREFTAWFAEPDGNERPRAGNMELGRMLLGMDYAPDRSGRGTPRFFDAVLEEGVLRVPLGEEA